MRVHFVFPKWEKLLESRPEIKDSVAGFGVGSFRMASLGVPTAAAALPDWASATLHDENLGPVDYDVSADLVGIGFFTPQAKSAYRISDEFRARGIPTLAGGIHPTVLPEEALEHFDAVTVGEVEGLWETILDDLRAGRMRGIYRAGDAREFRRLRPPRRELFRSSRYLRTGVVQISRGCAVGCDYCVVPRCYGQRYRFLEVEEVLKDIRALPNRSYYIADENLLFQDTANASYANRLLQALSKTSGGKVFYLAAYPWALRRVAIDFLAQLRSAGCRQIYLVMGQNASLAKELADPAVAEIVATCANEGIEIMGSFTFGHDGDGEECAERSLEFAAASQIGLAEFTLYTPWPGTAVHEEMHSTNRLLHRDWEKYNGANAVFKPEKLSAERLEEVFVDAWKGFYHGLDPFEMSKRYTRAFSSDILVTASGEVAGNRSHSDNSVGIDDRSSCEDLG